MKRVTEVWRTFMRDEKAAEVTELGIVLGLIVAGAIAVIGLLGGKVKQFYEDVNANLP